MTTTSSTSSSSAVTVVGSTSVELFTQTIDNPIGETAWTCGHIGYLDDNKNQLEVVGTITAANDYAMYAFTWRTGTQLSLLTNNNAGIRVQLMDVNGLNVLADSGGTNTSLQDAYQQLVDGTLDLKNGNYVIKLSHDTSVSKTLTLNFDIKLNSGTTYYERYKTSSGAQTMWDYIMAGGSMGYNAAATTAALLTASSQDEDINIFDYYV